MKDPIDFSKTFILYFTAQESPIINISEQLIWDTTVVQLLLTHFHWSIWISRRNRKIAFANKAYKHW